ncbi:MAG: enolase C-terminal domain-like protein [Flavobacteriales bacterium]
MKLSVHSYFLEFIHPFALAHGTRTGTQLAFVKLELEGVVAYGEASLPPYRNETFESVKKWIEQQYDTVVELLSSNPFENSEHIPFCNQNPSASAALQSAVLNWYAQSKGKPLIDFFEQTTSTPELTLTITKNDLPFLSEKLDLTEHFTHFKLKLTGKNDDLDFVKIVRNKTDLPFCIDINQGYENKEEVIHVIEKLEQLNCILIEQPLKDTNHDGHYWLKQRTALPIIADESIQQFEDLVQFHEAYSGANIKLMKCGGLFQAQQMLQFANQLNKETRFMKLVGCMSESSLGVSTAAVLASQCHMADLDSPYLNTNDPFEGFEIRKGNINLNERMYLKNHLLF